MCIDGDTAYIIEFKDRARPSGLGQLVTYRDLWVRQTGWTGKVVMRYIVGEGDPQVEEVARKMGIEVIVLNIPVYRRRYFRPEEFGLRR